MKWVKISERLPVGCKHRMFWDAKRKVEVFRAYDNADPMLNKLPSHYTHWLEITGPEDADKPEQYLEVLSETKELLERVVNSGLLSVCDCRRFNSVIQKIETISTARTAGGL